MRLTALLCFALAGCSAAWRRGKRGGGAGGASAVTNEFDGVECKKCMSTVMRLLVPAPRGCPEGNGSFVASSTASRVPSAFCDAALPKKRLRGADLAIAGGGVGTAEGNAATAT